MAAIPAVEQVLQEWDIKQTDVLLEKLEADRNNRQEQERKLREAENNRFVQGLFIYTCDLQCSCLKVVITSSTVTKYVYLYRP